MGPCASDRAGDQAPSLVLGCKPTDGRVSRRKEPRRVQVVGLMLTAECAGNVSQRHPGRSSNGRNSTGAKER